jgi:fructose-1-phosphate kinase PfkB-like protein
MCAVVPEAPLEARIALLDLAAENGLFRAASFTSEEMRFVRESLVLDKIDLLAVNVEEMRSLLELGSSKTTNEEIAKKGAETLSSCHENLKMSVTAGSTGSWTWDGQSLNYISAIDVPVASSGGAGDAYLAGILAGIAVGLSLREAQKLATAVAGVSVTSPHTIHLTMSSNDINRFMGK